MTYTGSFLYEPEIPEYTNGILTGFVLKTKSEINDGTKVGFYIPKLLPFVDCSSGPVERSISIDLDIFSNSSELSGINKNVPTANFIKVEYNGRSNFSQPMIALDESAHIFFKDGDYKHPKYTDANNNEARRKTDVLRMYVEANGNVNSKGGDAYFVELDSVNQRVHVHTSTLNGESHAYDLILDAAGSKIRALDDAGNSITIDTEGESIKLENSSGSMVDIVGEDIQMQCSGTVSIQCDKFDLKADSSVTIDAGSKYEMKSSKVSVTGDTKIEMKSVMMDCNIDAKFTCGAPTSMFGGVVSGMTIAPSPSPMSPPSPSATASTASKSVLVKSPKDKAANASKVVAAFTAIIPFLCKDIPGGGAAVAGILPSIPNSDVLI